MPEPLKDSGTLIDMKHDWVSEGTEDGIRRHWCENCNWEREQSKDQVWYRRPVGQFVKRHWLARLWSSPTTIEQWSNTEPQCDGKPLPARKRVLIPTFSRVNRWARTLR